MELVDPLHGYFPLLLLFDDFFAVDHGLYGVVFIGVVFVGFAVVGGFVLLVIEKGGEVDFPSAFFHFKILL